ncbi:GNAT family N-acetyltransferase [Aestuariibaculum suncheonense]|uniref:GNAT family N-acetyltransferase n=1 Tax=Aestuariibaculum suncheonense TaxID=1028745 RepID=A0A8J6UAN2_9FLAO|nr:GNAT family N-acetyltransferase [Aestuariibaculum suncheonense]MBD0835483.1 GNAT family N-acetyltransferase [Aestuariibaculum suncheonense]
MYTDYIFTSRRLGFRNWMTSDLNEFAKMNADKEVMKHFPKTLTTNETSAFIERLQNHFITHGFNYFAVEILETGEFIGFIGLANKIFESNFTPAVDIGWRLKKSAWGRGYATEGAKRCLKFAFDDLDLDRIIATCTKQNVNSEQVMKKIGMKKIAEFKHPELKAYPEYEVCLCYEVAKSEWNNDSKHK